MVSYFVLSKSDVTPRTTPYFTKNILVKCQDTEKSDQRFYHHSFICKLNYLENSTRLEIG